MERENKEEGQFELHVQVKDATEAEARELLAGMQGLLNDLGTKQCLVVLSKIKAYPNEFRKALALIDNPMVLSLIRSF